MNWRSNRPAKPWQIVKWAANNKKINQERKACKSGKITSKEPSFLGQFGPWMLVAKSMRRNNRSFNRKGGLDNGQNMQKERTTNEDNNGDIYGTRSRYEALRENDMKGNEEPSGMSQEEENPLEKEDGPRDYNGLKEKLKGKMPMVQACESHATNVSRKQQSLDHVGPSGVKYVINKRAGRRTGQGNQAAALEEHVLVRGSHKGASITRTIVVNRDESVMPNTIPELALHEHHNDPPNEGYGDEEERPFEEVIMYTEYDLPREGEAMEL